MEDHSERSERKAVELQSLVGRHTLCGVDQGIRLGNLVSFDRDVDSDTLRFNLDGRVYLAVEDPEDGYRSCMDELYIVDEEVVNSFPPCPVLARMEGDEDILELIDTGTGKTVLRVGTDSSDGYYPFFVAEFHPENMMVNQE